MIKSWFQRRHRYSKPRFDLYWVKMDGALVSVLTDLALHEIDPDPNRPTLLWVEVPFIESRENGLPTTSEFEALESSHNPVKELVVRACDAVFVGRITGGKLRRLLFYAGAADKVEQIAPQLRALLAPRRLAIESKPDPTWSYYRESMYPLPDDLQRIHNRHVRDLLEKNGDELTTPRPVDHHLHFPTAAARAEYLAAVVAMGFSEGDPPDASTQHEALPFELHIVRVDAVTEEHFDEVTTQLVRRAMQCGGEYEGWGCFGSSPQA